MSEQLADGALPDNMYVMWIGNKFTFVYKHDGYLNTLVGAQFSEAYAESRGYVLEPVVVLPVADHAALVQQLQGNVAPPREVVETMRQCLNELSVRYKANMSPHLNTDSEINYWCERLTKAQAALSWLAQWEVAG